MHTTCKRMHNLCQTRRWEKVSVGVYIFCCRTAAISASFTPPAAFRLQPLPAVATHGIDVDITFHYVISQFLAFGRLGVARRSLALLAGVARRSRRSRSVGSHHMQSSTATSRRRWRSYGVGEATPSHPTPLPKCSSPEHTKTNKIEPKIFSSAS